MMQEVQTEMNLSNDQKIYLMKEIKKTGAEEMKSSTPYFIFNRCAQVNCY